MAISVDSDVLNSWWYLPSKKDEAGFDMAIKVFEEFCEIKGAKVSVSVINLVNGTLIFVSDREKQYRIGTMAIATPIGHLTGENVPASLTVFGTGGELLARVLAGRISSDTGSVSLCIVGLRDDELQSVSTILKTVERIMLRVKNGESVGVVGSR